MRCRRAWMSAAKRGDGRSARDAATNMSLCRAISAPGSRKAGHAILRIEDEQSKGCLLLCPAFQLQLVAWGQGSSRTITRAARRLSNTPAICVCCPGWRSPDVLPRALLHVGNDGIHWLALGVVTLNADQCWLCRTPLRHLVRQGRQPTFQARGPASLPHTPQSGCCSLCSPLTVK